MISANQPNTKRIQQHAYITEKQICNRMNVDMLVCYHAGLWFTFIKTIFIVSNKIT